MKILLLTLNEEKMTIRSHYINWHKDLSKFSELNIRERSIGETTFWNWGKRMLKNPHNLRTVMRDKSSRMLYPLIKIDDVNNKFDWVITDFSYAFFTEEWDKIKIPKAMILEDCCDGLPHLQVKKAVDNKFDVLFCRYKREFFKYQKEYADKFADVKWLPHSVNTDMFKDYNLEKKYDVTMTGYHFPPIYYYRDMIFDVIEDKEYFTELKHKGYNKRNGGIYGDDYAKFLNQSKISITCGMIYNRPVMKFFEIPATRTLLMSNYFPELNELGFKDGENMIAIRDIEKVDKQIRDVLNDDDMRKEITDNGYDFIRKNHSGEVRAKQFIEQLENY